MPIEARRLVSQVLGVGLCLAGAVSAQVPPGHFVLTTARYATASCCWAGFGGLLIVSPSGSGTRVSNIPANMISGGPVILVAGPNSVVVRDAGRQLLVGETAIGNPTFALHILDLQGSAVVNARSIQFQTAPYGSGGTGVIGLSNGDALLLVVWGPQRAWAYVSLPAVTLTPLPGPVPDGIVAIPSGNGIFYSVQRSSSPSVSDIYELRLPGAPRLLGTVNAVPSLVAHPNGKLYLLDDRRWIVEFDPVTGASVLLSTMPVVDGWQVEPRTGDFILTTRGNTFLGGPGNLLRMTLGGTVTPIAAPPFYVSVGIAVEDNPRVYGPATPNPTTYAWQTALLPGGPPRAGSFGFALQLQTAPAGSAAGALLAAAAPGTFTVGNLQLLLDPTTLTAVGTVPASGLMPLPIPAQAAIIGQSVFFESVHVDTGGLAASAGLELLVQQ